MAVLDLQSRCAFLRAIFFLDKERLSGYPGFVLLTDLFLHLTGRDKFDAPEEWSCYQKIIPALARLGESFPNLRFIQDPEIFPVEFEILDLSIGSPGQCRLCGEDACSRDLGETPLSCFACGQGTQFREVCTAGHALCPSCYQIHFRESSCTHVQKTGQCYGKACPLLR